MEFIIQTDFAPDVEGAKKAGLPELVRCKDCLYGKKCRNGNKESAIECHNPDSIIQEVHLPNFYCADGEPKDGDGK